MGNAGALGRAAKHSEVAAGTRAVPAEAVRTAAPRGRAWEGVLERRSC